MKKQIRFLEFDASRIYGLDILRALSILFVVASHGNYLLPFKNNPLTYIIFDGVSIFFVLSGFLIGGILIKILERKDASPSNLFHFYRRRWLRTLPSYFLILTLLTILAYSFTSDFRFGNIYKYYFFSQNIITPHPSFFPEAWSLAVEEWFYLIVPAILFILVGFFRIPVRTTVLTTAIVVLLLSISFRYYRYEHVSVNSIAEWDLLFRKQVVTRLDSLMFGLIGAYIFYYHKFFWVRHKKVFFILGLAILIGMRLMTNFNLNGLGLYYCVFSFTLSAMGTLLLLPFLSEIRSGRGFLYVTLTSISIASYSMYLINLSVVQAWMLKPVAWLNLPSTSQSVVNYLTFWILTFTGSFLLYKYFEKPFMDMRSPETSSESKKEIKHQEPTGIQAE